MGDFKFLENPITERWVISAPRRAKRPDVARGYEPVCPFCPGREGEEKEVYRVSVLSSQLSVVGSESIGLSVNQTEKQTTEKHDSDNREPITENWKIRVLNNKFPFAPIHEVIVHSPAHDKNFDQLPTQQIELILQTYRQRYNTHKDKGHVYIFHNRGKGGGESLPHPHSQLAVIPFEVSIAHIPRLDPSASWEFGPAPLQEVSQVAQAPQVPQESETTSEIACDTRPPSRGAGDTRGTRDTFPMESITTVNTPHFYMFCPRTSQWPDEIWIAPKKRGRAYGEITDEEISDLAVALKRLIQIFDLRHGNEFPFNFYIYPGGDWYLRIIPRLKTIGGFELGTGIYVNTQDPQETIKFIKEHFENPDVEKIRSQQQAEYEKRA